MNEVVRGLIDNRRVRTMLFWSGRRSTLGRTNEDGRVLSHREESNASSRFVSEFKSFSSLKRDILVVSYSLSVWELFPLSYKFSTGFV